MAGRRPRRAAVSRNRAGAPLSLPPLAACRSPIPPFCLFSFFLSFSLSLFGRAREGFFLLERWLRPIASTVNQRVDSSQLTELRGLKLSTINQVVDRPLQPSTTRNIKKNSLSRGMALLTHTQRKDF